MTTLQLVANNLLSPAVSQVFAFPLRSHMGRLQIAPDTHLWGLCVIDLGSLVCRGQSLCEQWYKLQETFLQTTECRNKLWRMIQLDTLFPSFGLILLLRLVLESELQNSYAATMLSPFLHQGFVWHYLCSDLKGEGQRTHSCTWWSLRLLPLHFTLRIAIGTILKHSKSSFSPNCQKLPYKKDVFSNGCLPFFVQKNPKFNSFMQTSP